VVVEESISTLLNLGAVAAISIGTILLLWRVSERNHEHTSDFVLGYPADIFPAHDVVAGKALTALATTQARLLSLYAELAPTQESARLLYTFLRELRDIMDLAYRVAIVARAYGQPTQLDRLVSEVQQIERELADHVIHRLLAYEGDDRAALLTHRLATLRECVAELTPHAEARVPLLADDPPTTKLFPPRHRRRPIVANAGGASCTTPLQCVFFYVALVTSRSQT
jgi:hypothetical protein